MKKYKNYTFNPDNPHISVSLHRIDKKIAIVNNICKTENARDINEILLNLMTADIETRAKNS